MCAEFMQSTIAIMHITTSETRYKALLHEPSSTSTSGTELTEAVDVSTPCDGCGLDERIDVLHFPRRRLLLLRRVLVVVVPA